MLTSKMGMIYSLFRLICGNLYPAYASYKAVKTKNVKEYVKWMTYWIVFALFTCCETFTDVFCGFWFPFYYELKIILVIWLLSPATRGSNFLYRKFVHPMLTKKEVEIDEYLVRAKEQSYHTMLHLGTRGMSYATNMLMQTAIRQLPLASDKQDMACIESNEQYYPRPVDMADGPQNCVKSYVNPMDEEVFALHNPQVGPDPITRVTRSRRTQSKISSKKE